MIAVDLNYISPIEGAIIISRGDFTTSDCQRVVVDALNGQQPDVIISDMAPNASGIRELDCENIVSLASSALLFAFRTLKVGGTFMCKVWDSGNLPSFAKTMEKYFTSFKRVKPTASRSESAELFLLGMHFKGVEVSSLKHDQ